MAGREDAGISVHCYGHGHCKDAVWQRLLSLLEKAEHVGTSQRRGPSGRHTLQAKDNVFTGGTHKDLVRGDAF